MKSEFVLLILVHFALTWLDLLCSTHPPLCTAHHWWSICHCLCVAQISSARLIVRCTPARNFVANSKSLKAKEIQCTESFVLFASSPQIFSQNLKTPWIFRWSPTKVLLKHQWKIFTQSNRIYDFLSSYEWVKHTQFENIFLKRTQCYCLFFSDHSGLYDRECSTKLTDGCSPFIVRSLGEDLFGRNEEHSISGFKYVHNLKFIDQKWNGAIFVLLANLHKACNRNVILFSTRKLFLSRILARRFTKFSLPLLCFPVLMLRHPIGCSR